MNTLMQGLVAGAAGKAALDLSTYADMLLRGRPASQVPAKTIRRMAQATADVAEDAAATAEEAVGGPGAGPRTAGSGGESQEDSQDGEPGPRASAGGALSGYAIGLGLGVGYAALRAQLGSLPPGGTLIAGLALSAAAMAASDVPAVATGATTDPRGWSGPAWLSDILPHAAYGFVTAMTLEAIRSRPSRIGEAVRTFRS